ncbi:AAA family ATPase [uncultured Prevotella sp.]|uniref:AAA family ATPase n=1 Tax=uncultured Prevotella sp. TaxID=159272 RepID=UPI00266FDE61|nr:AAA family ATPase [uncultured Prevotella sp.]
MIIQRIEIDNFRSYYKSNAFELENGLNLIIGSNGDGKTTFYEALEWLFRTDGTNKMDSKFISKKRIEELFANESDDVRVAMTYEHKGVIKTLEKMFHFTKSFDGEVSTSNYTFSLIEQNGVERVVREGIRFDYDLPSEIRKYTMFKGESDLDVFQNSNALKMLVETFSDVKDFEAYFSFMEYATKKAEQARDNAQKLDSKNTQKIKSLKMTIDHESNMLSDIEREIKNKENEAVNFDSLLKSIEQSKEASKLLIAVNRRIETLSQKRAQTQARINENYTINLLDNMWILMGFGEIAEEYSAKINEVDKKRRKLEQSYIAAASADKVIKKMQTDFVPLPVHIPGQKIMQEMLDEEVCKICGRPAPKHSDAWEFMLHRLEEYRDSLKVDIDDEIEPYYKYNYVVELQKRDTTLNDNLSEITKLRHKIQEAIAFNNRLHDDVKKIDANLNLEYEQKKRILAQTDGLTEEQLLANYENISNWMDQKNRAETRIDVLKRQRAQHRVALEKAQEDLSKLAEGTSAAIYAKTALIIRQISDAFKTAKETNKKRLLHAIEDESNIFLEKLNSNDFKGTIRILEKANGQGEAVLMNNDNTRIFNPNTALRTTYLMSVLFAIGKLSGERDKSEFPLIFDAPTSSFTDAKESEFFNVISKLNKQVVIVTKSFLKESATGDVVLDQAKVDEISGRVFRIEKKKPFDDKKLGTIQTIISQIK